MVRYQGRHGISRSQRRSEETTQMGFLPEFYLQKKTLCLPNVVGAVNLYITSLLSRSRGMRKYRLEISPIPNYRLFSVLFPSSSTSCLSSSSSSEKQRRRVSRLSLSHLLTYSLTRARNRTNSFPSETTKGRCIGCIGALTHDRPFGSPFRKPFNDCASFF